MVQCLTSKYFTIFLGLAMLAGMWKAWFYSYHQNPSVVNFSPKEVYGDLGDINTVVREHDLNDTGNVRNHTDDLEPLHNATIHKQRDQEPVKHTEAEVQHAMAVNETTNALSKLETNYIITNKHFCKSKKSVQILIAICSSFDHAKRRQQIREKIRSEPLEEFKAHYVFFIGASTTNNRDIVEESLTYGDIIQGSFLDNYKNLTLKSILILHWVTSFCQGTSYVIKMDDDMVYNLTQVFHYMTDIPVPPSGVIVGLRNGHAKPHRNPKSKWYVPRSQYANNDYPPYVFGGAYILAGGAVEKLWKASFEVGFLWLEDVYITGVCREKAGIDIHAPKFAFFCRGKQSQLLMEKRKCPFVHAY